MKILVVDDDKLFLEFMNDILSKEGHHVLTAEDGLSALDVLRTHTPDVIFTDLVMPNIDGKRLCRIVRSVPQLGDVYLAVLTSVAAETEIDFAEFKADVCIAKGPFKDMAKTVFAVLDQPELSSSRCLSGEVIGIEKVHARRISMELLSLVKHLENMLGSMSEGILEIGPEQKIVYANPAAFSLTGIAEERLIGSPFLDLFSEDDQKRLIKTLKSKEGMSTKISEEDPLILNDHLVTVDILTLKEALSSVIVISDITERKRTEKELEQHFEGLVDERIADIKKINNQLKNEIIKHQQAKEALKESEERLRILFEFAPDAFFLNDVEGTLLDGNKTAEKLIGYKRHEVIGENFLTLGVLGPDQIQKAAELLAKNALGEATGPDEFTLNRKDGSHITVEISTVPVRIKKERLVMGIARDISRRLEAEKDALQSDKLQTMIEMAMAVCHEMNQPMQVVSGYAGLLLAGMAEDDPHYEDIKEINRQVEKMAVITTNLQNITTYKTRTYIKGRKMIDIEKSSK